MRGLPQLFRSPPSALWFCLRTSQSTKPRPVSIGAQYASDTPTTSPAPQSARQKRQPVQPMRVFSFEEVMPCTENDVDGSENSQKQDADPEGVETNRFKNARCPL